MRIRHILILALGSCASTSYSCQAPSGTIVDDLAPSLVAIIRPAAGVVADTVTIIAYAEDNVGVTAVTWRVNGVRLSDADSTRPYEQFWDPALSGPGTHEWVAVATDRAGNTTESEPVIYTVGP